MLVSGYGTLLYLADHCAFITQILATESVFATGRCLGNFFAGAKFLLHNPRAYISGRNLSR